MTFRFSDALFYLGSASAQVWSALMVFQILLIRDLRHQVEREIDSLWTDAKAWWPKLLVSLKSPEGLKSKLGQFGLSTETVLRADTHKNSFIRLIAAIKAHRIISDHLAQMAPLEDSDLTPQEWQHKFEPIAERIQELEVEKPEARPAFSVGIAGIVINLIACASGGLTGPIYSPALVAAVLGANLVLLYFFACQVRKALNHFDVTAQHDELTGQIVDLEREGRRFRKGRKIKPNS